MVEIVLQREQGWLRLDVRDTGIGMSSDGARRVFEEFYRERRAETRDTEGNGLGLSIVQRLVQRKGGSIDVSSVLGEGTSFCVRLPV